MPASQDFSKMVKECLRNKISAQRELYELFAPTMLGVCVRYTKDIHDAEEVLQEGFLKVFLNLHKFKGSGELMGWIRRIMINTALDYLKKKQQYQNEMVYDENMLHQVSDENPELTLAAKELAGLIRQLPIGYQTIFNLFAVEGYTHVEIGAMLGINEGTSRSQYARARGLLIRWLKELSLKEKGGLYGK